MPSLVVQKYGGTSVASLDHMRRVAAIIKNTLAEGVQVVAVVSAMRGAQKEAGGLSTDELLQLASQGATGSAHWSDQSPAYASLPRGREVDALVSLGEMMSAPLMALMLQSEDIPAISFNAYQAGLSLKGDFGSARISGARMQAIEQALEQGLVPVLAGFQGLNADCEVATMGRGSSDTTAVALAAALSADACLIYTDVAGVYTADPRVVPDARVIEQISFEEMTEAALMGAKVLDSRALRMAQQYQVPLRVLSSMEPNQKGTYIYNQESESGGSKK
ncbi:MAG: aspartate kinase [Gammaproteobacteria bacterium]